MHQTNKLYNKIKQSNPLDTKNFLDSAVKLVLENKYRQQTKFLYLFRAFYTKDHELTLDFTKQVLSKLHINQIIEYYANDDIEELVRIHYKNLPEFIAHLK